MKIVEINSFGNFSTGNIACDVAEEFQKQSNESIVLYARGNIKNIVKSKRISSKLDIYTHAFLSRIFDSVGLHSNHQTKKVIKFLDEYKPDIVHLHNIHGYYMNYPLLFDYLYEHKNIKVIWTLHDTWAITGHCCYFSRANCERWKTGCSNCPLKKSYPASILFDNSKRNYQLKKDTFTKIESNRMTFVTPSDWLANIVKNSYLNKYNVKTIYNGIDINKFVKKDKVELIPNKKVILGVASVWDDRKGLNVFLELSKVISEEYQIILIGKFTENIKLPTNITHIERTENVDELVKYYSSCNIFFNPTLDENYPTVNVEAQCCGAKVLTFDSGGSKETNLGNLYIQENRDISYIFENIKKISSVEVKEIDYNKANKERMAKEYYSLYNNQY